MSMLRAARPLRRLVARAAFAAALAVACSAPLARANDVELNVDAKASPGHTPRLTLVVHKDVRSATVELGAGAARLKQTKGPAASGSSVVFELPHKAPGRLTWRGTLRVVFDDDSEGSMPLSFQTEVLSAFKFEVVDVDLAQDRLTLKSERTTTRVELEVYTDAGALLASTGIPVDPPAPAGAPVQAGWIPTTEQDELRIHVAIYDDNGTFQTVDLFPYNLSIPHTDVEFESGKAIVRPSEEPKLQAALPEIAKAKIRYGDAIKVEGVSMKLFVSGHTDTVGGSDGNRALSQARAVAIASWFRRHGVDVAVYARGFGEDHLKVQTADDIDEARNRRAEYDVGVNGPTGGTAGWARVE